MNSKQSEYVKQLVDLGMNEREARLYVSLVQIKSASASDLQKLSGIQQNKIYELIGNLVRQGFCIERRAGNKRTFEVVDPQIVLDDRIDKLKTILKTSHELKDNLCKLYEAAEVDRQPYEYIEIIHGNINVHRKYLDLIKAAESEILSYVRPPFAISTEKMRNEQEDEYLKCRKKGVKVRHIFEHNEDSPDMILERINYDAKIKSDFRIHTNLPLKMFVFDRTTLMIADDELSSDEGELTVSIIKQETTVKGYVTLFDFIWNQSMKYDEWTKTQNQ